jgi:hypothetical protein
MAKKKNSLDNPEFAHTLAESILSSRKYRDLDIPQETVFDLIKQAQHSNPDLREIDHQSAKSCTISSPPIWETRITRPVWRSSRLPMKAGTRRP